MIVSGMRVVIITIHACMKPLRELRWSSPTFDPRTRDRLGPPWGWRRAHVRLGRSGDGTQHGASGCVSIADGLADAEVRGRFVQRRTRRVRSPKTAVSAEMLACADAALCTKKRGGKNRSGRLPATGVVNSAGVTAQ